MVSTGLWDIVNGVGLAEQVASTTLHEVGHTGELWHGGPPPVWSKATKTLYVEPNCKPNYTSIMSYMFQLVGEYDDSGQLHFDYSRDADFASHTLDENALNDAPFSHFPYRTAWFVPLNLKTEPLATALGASVAKKYCSGLPFPDPKPQDMFRFDGPLDDREDRLGYGPSIQLLFPGRELRRQQDAA